jgi:putative phosphoribosyl transferase
MTDTREINLLFDGLALPGTVGIPDGAHGLVLFAHGSGSSRLSSRNTFVAERLRRAGVGTLLFDLLTPLEDRDYARRFDIGLLTERLLDITHWVHAQPTMRDYALGYFGASTGAAAALAAAARLGGTIRAVVCRGGRPDLALASLPRVQTPTLLIIGGADVGVLDLNEDAYARLGGPKELAIIPDATHLFDEPGALEQVADLAADWFVRHLGGQGERAAPWAA